MNPTLPPLSNEVPGLAPHGGRHGGFEFAARPLHAAAGMARMVARRSPAPLALGRIAKDALLITLLLLLNIFGNVGAAVFFAVLLGMTFYSPTAAFKALAIMWLGLMCNQGLVPKSLTWTPCRLVLPLIAFVRFSFDLIALKASLFRPFYTVFAVYCGVMAVCSVMSGWYTTIALVKLANFFISFTAVWAGTFVLVRKRVAIGEWLVSLIVATTVIGLLAIMFVNRGMVSPHHYVGPIGDLNHFGGAFLHPNCHSTYGAIFILLLVMVFVYTNYQRRWIVWPLIAIWAVFLVWSKARTSFVSTGLGLVTLFPFLVRSARSTWIRRVNVSRSTAVGAGLAVAVALVIANFVTGNSIADAVITFANKSSRLSDTGEVELNIDSVVFSRIGKMEESMVNFRENPLFGIGFQVAKSEFFVRNATLFSAPAEKGFLPSAVLEEGGVLGTAFFIAFILVLPLTFLAERNTPALVIFMAFMGQTLTEVTIFSPGGSGGFSWLMVGAAYVFGESTWVRKPTPAPPIRQQAAINVARPALRGMSPVPLRLPSPG